ncbi:alpha/beta-hydrolase [Thozetella sp. PMI_491]|nr:alpha/beta-hydrolase [Thozetella sp. PMI_491]
MTRYFFLFLAITLGAVAGGCSTPSVTTVAIPAGTVVGSVVDDVEYYRGIPFAQPPVGSLRLKPPVRLETFDTIQATGFGPACPQMTGIEATSLLLEVAALPGLASTLSFLSGAPVDVTEDCLTISVMRPRGTAPNAKLPVLFWIFGGGFETGSPQGFNASVLIPRSVAQHKPFIFVAVNYRLGGFGFLGGREILADGAANLGLLDQRMGLQWVADNIEAFGGDPNAVTIWGESAGAVSVFDQLALYDGNNTYKGSPLFRGAIMNSGNIAPTEPVDGPKAQVIFDTVVEAAGCATTPDKLECLRNVDYDTYVNATNVVPSFLSYTSVALSYGPRPDGRILTASPDELASAGKYAAVPLIIGDQEDEGTIAALFQTNITTKSALISYLNDIFFHGATREQITAFVDTYPDSVESNITYPEFNRLAAIIGDYEYTLMRRVFLGTLPASVPAWSYLATYGRGTPILGTFHVSDLPRLFYGTDDVSHSLQSRYIAFVSSLNPNGGMSESPSGYQGYWPTWQGGHQLLEFGANSTGILFDNFRSSSFEYLRAHLSVLRL